IIVAGRLVQGFGGGLLSALAYVLVRRVFPAIAWPRAFALLSSVWSVSVLLGPLVGGVFARYGDWRGAFFAITAIAAVLAIVTLRVLPAALGDGSGRIPSLPARRLALICAAIAVMSLAAVVDMPAVKAALIVIAIAALAAMLRLNRASSVPLLP